MKYLYSSKTLSFLFLLSLSGCVFCDCWDNYDCWDKKVKHRRTVELSAALAPGGFLNAETCYGSIDVKGADVKECRVIATVIARAGTEEEARRLAEETEITLDPSGDGLDLEIDKPSCGKNEHVSVSLEITIPKRTRLECATTYGNISISDIEADVKGKTNYGQVMAIRLVGGIELFTDYGSVTCQEMSGDLEAKTNYGSVSAVYLPSAPPICNVTLISDYGDIQFTPPTGFSAVAQLSTHYGSISTDTPMTVKGKISKSMTGIINEGEGKLLAKTCYGSIRINKQSGN